MKKKKLYDLILQQEKQIKYLADKVNYMEQKLSESLCQGETKTISSNNFSNHMEFSDESL